MLTVGVAAAAGLGAVVRYLVDQLVQRRTPGDFPYGTLLVNVSGSLLFGLLIGLNLHQGLPSSVTVVAGIGFAGGYTTLSTWAWESLALAESGELWQALLNVVGSFAIGLAAAAVGLGLALL